MLLFRASESLRRSKSLGGRTRSLTGPGGGRSIAPPITHLRDQREGRTRAGHRAPDNPRSAPERSAGAGRGRAYARQPTVGPAYNSATAAAGGALRLRAPTSAGVAMRLMAIERCFAQLEGSGPCSETHDKPQTATSVAKVSDLRQQTMPLTVATRFGVRRRGLRMAQGVGGQFDDLTTRLDSQGVACTAPCQP